MQVLAAAHEDTTAERWCDQLLAGAMASAIADPRSSLGRRGLQVPDPVIRAAWRFHLSLASACGQREEREGEHAQDAEVPARTPADAGLLVEWLGLPESRREAAYLKVFGFVISKRCPAYETEFLSWKEGVHRAQHMADAAGFYRAFGLEPDPAEPQRPDSLALQLEFLSLLQQKLATAEQEAEQESEQEPGAASGAVRAEVSRAAIRAFVQDHLAWWVPAFARRLEQLAREDADDSPPQLARDLRCLSGVGRALCSWMDGTRERLGIPPRKGELRPSVAPPDAEAGSCGTCDGCSSPGATEPGA